ncbi:DUF6273 domain-containing protein [Geodermatophilus amargosae]|uniref:DUF6273 domain-containing protein n=1 Tax=Geodermatophilus amargosae TaxID=1296565 RepID=UPI0034DE1361
MPVAHALRDARPGDLVEFGRYPQRADGADRTPVSWLVLARRGDEVLLVSARVLDCRRWHDEPAETTWRDSSMRRWLDGTFLPRAFSDAERELLVPHRCDDDGDGTPDTVDRVFLLGVREVRSLTHPGRGDGVDRRAVATPFAVQEKGDGCRLYVYDKGVEEDHLLVDGERRGCSWWWLRSQPQARGGTASRAAFVGARGDVKSYGRVDRSRIGVRPAVALDASLALGSR